MKKLLGVLIIAATMISSTFALGLSIGGKGLMGGRLDTLTSSAESVTKDFNSAMNKLTYGGGAYVNAELFWGLGAQAEVNFVHNKLTGINYLDIPLMGWWELNFFDRFKIGLGGGLNLSRIINKTDSFAGVTQDLKNMSKWNQGIAVGANLKFFFNKHFGLVLGANGVFEMKPNDFFNEAVKGNVNKIVAGDDTKRKELYANLGLEFKLF